MKIIKLTIMSIVISSLSGCTLAYKSERITDNVKVTKYGILGIAGNKTVTGICSLYATQEVVSSSPVETTKKTSK